VFSAAKLIALGLGAIALGGGGLYVRSIWHKAGDRDRAVAALDVATRSFNDRLAKVDADRKAAEAGAARLADDLVNLREQFENLPPVVPKTLTKVVEVPGAPCPAARLTDVFRVHWNNAASAGSPAD
jgi:hypothetical protein